MRNSKYISECTPINITREKEIKKIINRNKYKDITLFIGITLATLIVLTCLSANIVAPNDPLKVDISNIFLKPTADYPLGTDQLGRCILSRILYGGQASIFIALLSLLLTVTIGATVGLLSASYKSLDKILMGICEITLAFPGILLAIVIVGFLGPSIINVMIAISFVSWTKYARITRNLTLSIKESGFVKAAKVCGTSKLNIIIRHILTNIISTILTIMMTDIGGTILRLATLSFIGLGAQHPTPEWGIMINEARRYIDYAPHMIIYPILAIFVTVLAFNLIGDSLRDKLDTNRY